MKVTRKQLLDALAQLPNDIEKHLYFGGAHTIRVPVIESPISFIRDYPKGFAPAIKTLVFTIDFDEMDWKLYNLDL
jgi:hypothetical protein